MFLHKFCKEEHNPIKGSDLLVGNLYKYHDIETDELADAEEGRFDFSLEIENPVEIPKPVAIALFSPAIVFGEAQAQYQLPGGINAYVDYLDIGEIGAEKVVVKSAKVDLQRVAHNSLIFCMSVGPADFSSPFDGYDDRWTCPLHAANQLAEKLAHLIWGSICLERYTGAANFLPLAQLGKLTLHCRHQAVLYRERTTKVTSDNVPELTQIISSYADSPFWKPKEYSDENEYRFLFELSDGKKIFPVNKKDLLIDPNFLRSGLVA